MDTFRGESSATCTWLVLLGCNSGNLIPHLGDTGQFVEPVTNLPQILEESFPVEVGIHDDRLDDGTLECLLTVDGRFQMGPPCNMVQLDKHRDGIEHEL